MAEIADLWPSEIKVDVLSPTMILNAQAEILSQRTQGLIQPEIIGETKGPLQKLYFDLVAAANNGSRNRILIVTQRLDQPYPAVVTARVLADERDVELISDTLPTKIDWGLDSAEEVSRSRVVLTPGEFTRLIALVFQSVEVQTNLISILAKANERKTPLPRLRQGKGADKLIAATEGKVAQQETPAPTT